MPITQDGTLRMIMALRASNMRLPSHVRYEPSRRDPPGKTPELRRNVLAFRRFIRSFIEFVGDNVAESRLLYERDDVDHLLVAGVFFSPNADRSVRFTCVEGFELCDQGLTTQRLGGGVSIGSFCAVERDRQEMEGARCCDVNFILLLVTTTCSTPAVGSSMGKACSSRLKVVVTSRKMSRRKTTSTNEVMSIDAAVLPLPLVERKFTPHHPPEWAM